MYSCINNLLYHYINILIFCDIILQLHLYMIILVYHYIKCGPRQPLPLGPPPRRGGPGALLGPAPPRRGGLGALLGGRASGQRAGRAVYGIQEKSDDLAVPIFKDNCCHGLV